jgi:hypothetical protein
LILVVLGFVGYLSNTIFNPTKTMGIMGADYSAIKKIYDLSLSKVDHWCIRGDNDSCRCEDPLEAIPRAEFKAWTAAHKANVADVSLYRAIYGSAPTKIDVATGKPRPPIDVAFLGESVVEAMDGRWLGKKIVRATGEKEGQEGKKPDIGKVFERFFRKEKGGPLEGVALGIAGDYVSSARILSFLFLFLNVNSSNIFHSLKISLNRPQMSFGVSSTTKCRMISTRKCGGSFLE